MDSGQSQIVGSCSTVDGKMSTGVQVCDSDSMLRGFCAPHISNRTGLRQTEEATLRGTKIPCPQRPYSKKHLFFWNQPVAAEIKDDPRQLEFIHGSPMCGGGAMTAMSGFAHPSSTAFFLNAPSDSKCRLDG